MLTRSSDALSVKKSNSPSPTVEVESDSLEEQDVMLDQVVLPVLARYASQQTELTATVYLQEMESVNFGRPSMSQFLTVIGSDAVLQIVARAFSARVGLKSRISDHVIPTVKHAVCAYHLEDGKVWVPDEGCTWLAYESAQVDGELDSLGTKVKVQDIADEFESDGGLDQDGSNPARGDDDTSVEPKNGVGRRFRSARADARVGAIRQTIEQIFGLPVGSVALRGPDGRALNANALIRTLRRRWEE